MSKRSTFRNIIIQGATIIFSILLAFSIDAWWDQRKQNKTEREQLESIKSELKVGLSNLDNILSAVDFHANNLDSLIIMMRNAKSKSIEVSGPLLGSMIMWRTSDVSLSTLNTMIASGTLNQLSNPELRVKLANLPAVQTDLTEDEVMAKDFSENQMVPLLARMGLASTAYANRPGFKGYASRTPIGDFEQVSPTEELIGMLTVRRVHFWYTQSQLPIFRDYIEDLTKLIDDELEK
jgi:hypothetical protein